MVLTYEDEERVRQKSLPHKLHVAKKRIRRMQASTYMHAYMSIHGCSQSRSHLVGTDALLFEIAHFLTQKQALPHDGVAASIGLVQQSHLSVQQPLLLLALSAKHTKVLRRALHAVLPQVHVVPHQGHGFDNTRCVVLLVIMQGIVSCDSGCLSVSLSVCLSAHLEPLGRCAKIYIKFNIYGQIYSYSFACIYEHMFIHTYLCLYAYLHTCI
jgi:hypothetical protein